MTPQQELELIEIELELRRRQQGPAAVPPPPAVNAPRGVLAGLGEVAAQAPQHVRETATATLTGVPKAFAGLLDLPTLFKQYGESKTGGKVFPGASKLPMLTPMVDRVRDAVAGRPLGNETPTAIAESAVGGWAGMAAGGTANELINRGVNPFLALALSAAVPVGASKLGQAGSLDPRQALAQGRVSRALEGVDEAQLSQMERAQADAAARGVPIFPSQATPMPAPGPLALETELAASQSRGGRQFQQFLLKQPLQAQDAMEQTLRRYLPTSTQSPDQVAGRVQEAAGRAVKQGAKDAQDRTQGLYKEALSSNKGLGEQEISGMFSELQQAAQKFRGNKDIERGISDLEKRIKSIVDPVNADVEKALLARLEAAKAKGGNNMADYRALQEAQKAVDNFKLQRQAAIDNLYRTHQSFVEDLSKMSPTGLPAYSDFNAKTLRELSEQVLRSRFEKLDGRLELARNLTASGKQAVERGPFDPTVQAWKAKGDPNRFVNNLAHKPQVFEEISRVVDDVGPPGQPMIQNTGRDAGRDALALAFRNKKDEAFRLSMEGEVSQASPAMFRNSLMGTPGQKEALERSLRAAGVDPTDLLKDIDVISMAGRPTAARGVRIPDTGISPVDLARATVGGSLQRQHGQMNIMRALLNRLSDNQVAAILNRPDSVAAMRKVAGAQAMQPREALLRVLVASNAQTMD